MAVIFIQSGGPYSSKMAHLITPDNATVSSASNICSCSKTVCSGDYIFGENCTPANNNNNDNRETSSPEFERYKMGKFDNNFTLPPLAESPKSDDCSLFSLSPAASISCSSSSRHSESPPNGAYLFPKNNSHNHQNGVENNQKANIFRNLEHYFRDLNKNHDQNSCDSGFESCPGSSGDSKSPIFPVIVESPSSSSDDSNDSQSTGIACVWADCQIRVNITVNYSHNDGRPSPSSNDERHFYELHEHVMENHVKVLRTNKQISPCKASGCEKSKQTSSSSPNYACMWRGCRFFEQHCKSYEWLENHVLEKHGGPKPYRCVVENCTQRFTSRFYLEKHVNAHFSLKLVAAVAASSGFQTKKMSLSSSSNDSGVVAKSGEAAKKRANVERRSHLLRCDSFEDDSRLDDLLRWKAILAYKERQNKWKSKNRNSHAKVGHCSIENDEFTNNNKDSNVDSANLSRNSCLSNGKSASSNDDYSPFFHEICCAKDVKNLLKKHGKCLEANSEITFSCLIMAHRKTVESETTKEKSNKYVEYLCEFSPHGILPPMWIPEQSFHSTITVPLDTLRQFCDCI